MSSIWVKMNVPAGRRKRVGDGFGASDLLVRAGVYHILFAFYGTTAQYVKDSLVATVHAHVNVEKNAVKLSTVFRVYARRRRFPIVPFTESGLRAAAKFIAFY